MLKIHPKLWYVKTNREHEEDLAYMTYHEENKAFDKRKETGLSWAKGRYRNGNTYEPDPVILDNTPLEGFLIGESVSRWSTSNKVFRVRDPRGFIVEIPTDNLAMLLQSGTISKSVVQGKCVWGREGNNHILLNEGSEPYKEAIANMNKIAEEKELSKNRSFITPSKWSEGDKLIRFNDNNEEIWFIGKFDLTWKVTPNKYSGECPREVCEKNVKLFLLRKTNYNRWKTTASVPSKVISVEKDTYEETHKQAMAWCDHQEVEPYSAYYDYHKHGLVNGHIRKISYNKYNLSYRDDVKLIKVEKV